MESDGRMFEANIVVIIIFLEKNCRKRKIINLLKYSQMFVYVFVEPIARLVILSRGVYQRIYNHNCQVTYQKKAINTNGLCVAMLQIAFTLGTAISPIGARELCNDK